ncbi:penicillin acylase family protein [Salinispirillum marinum]|uniref:Penicillin acylase family protein n=2 Tax=Saccharospirillaceae TaxID=255527 RepID=A0ABV8BDP7_9GAMM
MRYTTPLQVLLVIGVVLTSTLGMTAYQYLQGSLPRLQGNHIVPGLQSRVEIGRDSQGIPSLRASFRTDIAYALGYLHAQERFFQMDLQRRTAAGELAALLGPSALPQDRRNRMHVFRQRAERAIAQLPDEQRAVLEAYTAGVNQGIGEQREPSAEYLLLRQTPEPWRAEDSALVIYAFYLALQDSQGERERSLDALAQVVPEDWFRFLLAADASQESGLTPIDYPTVVLPSTPYTELVADPVPHAPVQESWPTMSNGVAVSGRLTDHGSALVAGDIHLPLRVPNYWYRATWQVSGSDHVIAGLTLPGTPIMALGSNQQLAWTFVNAFADASDVIRLQTRADEYLTPDGWESFTVLDEAINIRGSSPQPLNIRYTRWGPVIGQDHNGQWLALRWLAHDDNSVNFDLLALETADQLSDVLPLRRMGIPGQGMLVGDRAGEILWTYAGWLPNRRDQDGNLPRDWSTTNAALAGFQLNNPTLRGADRLWHANNAPLADPALADQGFAPGYRAQRLAAQLNSSERFTTTDLFNLLQDEQTPAMQRWYEHLQAHIETLADTERAAAEAALADWTGSASADSVAYRFVRTYRDELLARVLGPVFAHVAQQSATFATARITQRIDTPLWRLVQSAEPHLLNPAYDTWQDLFTGAARNALNSLEGEQRLLENATWGHINRTTFEHPMGNEIPVLRWIMNIPGSPRGGDLYSINVNSGRLGASFRMAVAPGQETEGLLHMPTSQSGHLLSPYYWRGHQDWATGTPSPFLPGTTEYQLTLIPERPA